jgi:hypothetical protein
VCVGGGSGLIALDGSGGVGYLVKHCWLFLSCCRNCKSQESRFVRCNMAHTRFVWQECHSKQQKTIIEKRKSTASDCDVLFLSFFLIFFEKLECLEHQLENNGFLDLKIFLSFLTAPSNCHLSETIIWMSTSSLFGTHRTLLHLLKTNGRDCYKTFTFNFKSKRSINRRSGRSSGNNKMRANFLFTFFFSGIRELDKDIMTVNRYFFVPPYLGLAAITLHGCQRISHWSISTLSSLLAHCLYRRAVKKDSRNNLIFPIYPSLHSRYVHTAFVFALVCLNFIAPWGIIDFSPPSNDFPHFRLRIYISFVCVCAWCVCFLTHHHQWWDGILRPPF